MSLRDLLLVSGRPRSRQIFQRAQIVVVLGASAAVVRRCSSDEQTADISNLTQVKSFFSSDFRVTEVPERINPRISGGQKLPDGLTFEPPDCAKTSRQPQVPSNVEGNMTAMTAEGAG
jgi:hypothetical protein